MWLSDGSGGSWATVLDVHGAPGSSGWRQLVPGRPLHGPWEAVELARLGPDGVSGRHRHSRTHEIYFVLRGACALDLDGAVTEMTPGCLALVTAGSTHGLRNIGDGDFSWLVVEVPAPNLIPTTARKVPPVHPRLQPVDLSVVGRVDLAQHGASPLIDVVLERLDAGDTLALDATGCEVFGYLIGGSATLTASAATHPVAADTGVTLTLGESAVLTAESPCTFLRVRSSAEDVAAP
ncbi:cupin domain-containing protein [Streptomyces sp. NPDC020472]|uniref:cupin domain-containing protein n=1 Tax=Streptomyces sp. NPDC020472 TaxID=3365075 RepID=UPI0037A30057